MDLLDKMASSARWETEAVTVTAIHMTVNRGLPSVRAFVEHLRARYASASA